MESKVELQKILAKHIGPGPNGSTKSDDGRLMHPWDHPEYVAAKAALEAKQAELAKRAVVPFPLEPIPFDRPATRKATAELEDIFAAALATLAESAVKAVAKAVVKPETKKFAAPASPAMYQVTTSSGTTTRTVRAIPSAYGGLLRKADSMEGQDDATAVAAIIAAIIASIDWPVLTRAVQASRKALEAVAVDAATKIADQLGIAASKARAGLATAIESRVTALATLLIDASKDMLRQMLAGALGVGGTAEAIASAVRRASVFSRDRAATIALSEIATANGIGSVSAIGAGGAKKQWITEQDDRTCPVCMGNEEVGPIDVDALFPSGHLAPGAHVNCRCVINAVVGG